MEHRRTRHTRRSRSDRRSSRSRSGLENFPFRTEGASPVHFRSRDRSCIGHQPMTEAQNAGSSQGATLPVGIWLRMYLRLFAVQGSWNYESLLGNGIAFCMEPALRLLPGGMKGQRYSEALGRHSRYFNAHPYLAGVAVGALARAELDGVARVMIERFRTALGGPLGSVGDRLVWASWLPLCSLLALA